MEKNIQNGGKQEKVTTIKERKGSINNPKLPKYGHYPAPHQTRQARLAMIEKQVQYVPIRINRMVI